MAIVEHLGVNETGHLTLHGIDLVSLCEEYGTPLFVFDETTLIESFRKFRRAFEDAYSKVMICYSIKTNNNLAICKILRREGAFAEVSSGLDLYVALKAGFRGEHIIFDGPYKPEETLKRALEENVLLVNVESFTEMKRLNRIAGKMGIKQPIGIRVNPFKDPGFFKYFSLTNLINAAHCNLNSRFGFSLDEALDAFKKAVKFDNLNVVGIMMHPYHSAIEILLPLMHRLYEELGISLEYLNIGGGFNPGDVRLIGSKELIFDIIRRKIGLKSKLMEKIKLPEIESIAKLITSKIRQELKALPEPTLVVEPGRFLVSSAGILLVRVDHVKSAGGYKWAIVDGGSNIVPRFSPVELRKIIVANRASEEPNEEINVAGPLLYPNDFITLRTMLPKIREGDILSILGCGAYTLSRSNQFLYPRPAVVLVNLKGKVKIIREKETYEDLLRKDKDI